jgi:hypothetical protein
MRSAILIALSASFAFLVATNASATSSINLIYLDGSSVGDQSACAGDPGCVQAAEGDTVRFAVTVDVDSTGMSGYAFDIVWDAECILGQRDFTVIPQIPGCNPAQTDTLNFSKFKTRANLKFTAPNPTPPPDTLLLGNYNLLDNFATQESDTTQVGYVTSWDGTSISITGPFIASTSFRLGIVALDVGNIMDGESVVQPVFFRPDGPAFGDSSFNSFTPNFGDGTVRVPEPGPTMLIVTSLSALGLLALRSRRD